MEYNYLKLESRDDVLLVSVSHPPVNALSMELLQELISVFENDAASDDIGCIVITGAGKTFIAGADLKMFKSHDTDTGDHPAIRVGNDLFNQIEVYPKPVIAAVNGACLGGGNELAIACDFRIASLVAFFGQPEIKLGILPGWGGLQRLPKLIGRGAALDLSLTGRHISAEEALRMGLINEVVEPDRLLDRALELGNELAKLPPLAVTAIKERLTRGLSESQGQAIRDDEWAFNEMLRSEDGQEGISAFLEKREPRWQGR